MAYKEYKVERRSEGSALRDYIAEKLGISGRNAKRLLDARHVSVNGRRVWMAGHALQPGDTVGVLQVAVAPPPDERVPVLYQDGEYAVVNKPAGLDSNGDRSLEARVREEAGRRDWSAVHRLDRDTSGCLLMAKTRVAFDAVVPVFREHRVAKEYRAIVAGRVPPAPQTISETLDGQRAVTWITTLGATPTASHLLVRTETGRTHQIRRHLAGLRHPILGDRQHGLQRGLDAAHLSIPRQMLHAITLSLRNPLSNVEIKARAPLPNDFQTCLKQFGLRA